MDKLNLKYGSVVKVKNTGSELDGTVVQVAGVSIRGVQDFYILEFLSRAPRVINGEMFSAFVLTEACLEIF